MWLAMNQVAVDKQPSCTDIDGLSFVLVLMVCLFCIGVDRVFCIDVDDLSFVLMLMVCLLY